MPQDSLNPLPSGTKVRASEFIMARDAPEFNFSDLPADRMWTSELVRALDISPAAFRAFKESSAKRATRFEVHGDEEAHGTSSKVNPDVSIPGTATRPGDVEKDLHKEQTKIAWDECYRAFNQLMWPENPGLVFSEDDKLEFTLPKRRKKARTWFMMTAAHDMLMSDRVEAIEKVMQAKGWLEGDEVEEDEEKKLDRMSPLQSGTLLTLKLDWGGFTTLDVSKVKPTCFAALLTEKPVLANRAGTRWPRLGGAPTTSAEKLNEGHRVERIRFLSTGASDIFEELVGPPMPGNGEAVLRPFKPLFLCYKELLKRYENSGPIPVTDQNVANDGPGEEQCFGENTNSSLNPLNESVKVSEKPQEKNHNCENFEGGGKENIADSTSDQQSGPSNAPEPEQADKKDQIREANKRVTGQAILEMMQNELRAESKSHLEYRHRTKQWIAFDNLWHLFFTGDIIYHPKLDQALQVLCVHNGRAIIDAYVDNTDANAPAIPQIAGSSSPFQILAVGIDFNGESFGPVEHEYIIESWEGEQTITSLPVYPIEYARVAGDESEAEAIPFPSAKEAALRLRGAKFCELVNSSQVAHREYRGFDIGKFREQVSSQARDSRWLFSNAR